MPARVWTAFSPRFGQTPSPWVSWAQCMPHTVRGSTMHWPAPGFEICWQVGFLQLEVCTLSGYCLIRFSCCCKKQVSPLFRQQKDAKMSPLGFGLFPQLNPVCSRMCHYLSIHCLYFAFFSEHDRQSAEKLRPCLLIRLEMILSFDAKECGWLECIASCSLFQRALVTKLVIIRDKTSFKSAYASQWAQDNDITSNSISWQYHNYFVSKLGLVVIFSPSDGCNASLQYKQITCRKNGSNFLTWIIGSTILLSSNGGYVLL
jgi:hypothetical protein